MNQDPAQTASNDSSIEKLQEKLDRISDEVLRRFKMPCRLAHLHLLALNEVRVSVFVLFKRRKDQERYQRNMNSWQAKLNEYIHQCLSREGIRADGRLSIDYQLESEEAQKAEMRARSTNIPTEEDFARAKRLDAQRNRHLDRVSENVKQRFVHRCPLHNLYLFLDSEVDFRTYVFFKTDADISQCKANGMATAIEDAVYEELEWYGRGKRGECVVAFEYDSDENVQRNFEGDYLFRLR